MGPVTANPKKPKRIRGFQINTRLQIKIFKAVAHVFSASGRKRESLSPRGRVEPPPPGVKLEFLTTGKSAGGAAQMIVYEPSAPLRHGAWRKGRRNGVPTRIVKKLINRNSWANAFPFSTHVVTILINLVTRKEEKILLNGA